MSMSDDDMAKALADFQRGPKSEPLTEAEQAARVDAFRVFAMARLNYILDRAVAAAEAEEADGS